MEATKIEQAISVLEKIYGTQTRYSSKSGMEQVIATVLSQRTNYQDEKTAYDNMFARFGDWEGIMNAPLPELIEAIKTSNYPEVKAPRIQEILSQIKAERGNFNLDFIKDMDVDDAAEWLMKLPGVGFKTATFTLLFSFRKPILPVDTHVYRTSQRLGIIKTSVSEARAHKLLRAMLPQTAAAMLNFHKLFFKHGQKVCRWSAPQCNSCPLREICDSYALKKDLFKKHQAVIG